MNKNEKKFPNGKPQLKRLTKEEYERLRIQSYDPIF